ncbi:MAG: hypothetical protein BWY04_01010 [candidate division CPR1 bacterium ADurb.Bin160]|uniref:Uncharacterized protein n=1 Tax=candidate division CPR1 bacterium ADurb.Bin160 TaxID=1852826 RepID=A0A1V5ZMH2_9BACT|nr:MAG: hypothetical protein BWY04_01010 [candidate division CPR1 bacterium ADurb.Bin160]
MNQKCDQCGFLHPPLKRGEKCSMIKISANKKPNQICDQCGFLHPPLEDGDVCPMIKK